MLTTRTVLFTLLSVFPFTTNAANIDWVNFSGWPNGSLSETGLTSSSGLTVDATFANTSNMRSGYPLASTATLDNPAWPFDNNDLSVVTTISADSSTLTAELTLEFTSVGGLPAGGSLAVIDLEGLGSFVRFSGFQNGSSVDVDWQVAYFQTAGVDAAPPIWDQITNTLSGTIASGWPGTTNNFAFLTTDVQLDSVLMEINTVQNDGVEFAVSDQSVVPIPAALWLFASGIAGLGLLTRHKRQQS